MADEQQRGDCPTGQQDFINEQCWLLEEARRSGRDVSIASLLNGCPAALRQRLLTELLAVDVEYQLREGRSPIAAEYGSLSDDVAPLLAKVLRRARLRLADDQATVTLAGIASPPLGLPEPLGSYRFLSLLGRGGYGNVWRACDERVGRDVAIKLPHRSSLTPQERERLHREARAAAQLDHPGIVPLIEADEIDGRVFLVSKLVPGISLRDWLESNDPSDQQAAAFGQQIAAALAHAHECKIIHRDVKPGNVLVDAAERLHLTDFGLAKWLDDDSSVTQSATVVGTPAYLAPEQADGRSREADERTDVYGLGVVLYELLTGAAPFRGDTRAILHQVCHVEPERPTVLDPRISRDLETVALKCVEKTPEQRYQTATEVADELARFLDGRPIKARPVGYAGRARRWSNRNRALTAALATSLVSVLVGLATTVYYAVEAQQQANIATSQANLARAEQLRAEEAVVLATKRLAAQQRTTANLQLSTLPDLIRQNAIHAGQRLDQLEADEVSDGFAVRYYRACVDQIVQPVLQLPSDSLPFYLRGHPIYRTIAISPDGRWLVATRGNTPVLDVWDLADNSHATTLTSGGHAPAIVCRFDDSSQRLGYGDTAGRVVAWDSAFNWERTIVEAGEMANARDDWGMGAPRCIREIAFSPSGDRLAAAGGGTVRVHQLAGTADVITLKPAHYGSIQAMDWFPDGERLLVGNREGRRDPPGQAIYCWELANPENPLRFFSGDYENIFDVQVSPDGKTLITVFPDGVRAWTSEGLLVEKIAPSGYGAEFSPDGRQLAILTVSGVTVVDTQSWKKTGGSNRRANLYPLVHWQPDNASILYVDTAGAVFKWNVIGSPPRRLPWPADATAWPVIEDRWLAVDDGPKRGRWLQSLKSSSTVPLDASLPTYGWRPEHRLNGCCTAADGSWVAAVTGRGIVECFDADTGAKRWVWRWDRTDERDLAWWTVSALQTIQLDGREAIAAGIIGIPKNEADGDPLEPSIACIDPQTGAEAQRLLTNSRISCLLAYSRRKQLLADWDEAGPLRLVDLAKANRVRDLGSIDTRGTALSFSGDGSQLYATSYSGALARWDTETWQCFRRPGFLTATPRQLQSAKDDSCLFALAGGKVRFYDPITLESQGELITTGVVDQLIEDPSGDVWYRLSKVPGIWSLTPNASPTKPVALPTAAEGPTVDR